MNLLEGGKGVEGRVGRGRREGGGWTWGREGGWGEREGGEGSCGGMVGRGGEGRGGEGGEGIEGRGGREGGEGEGGEGEGGMTVIHILIGMFNSNPMIPQYLNNNLT